MGMPSRNVCYDWSENLTGGNIQLEECIVQKWGNIVHENLIFWTKSSWKVNVFTSDSHFEQEVYLAPRWSPRFILKYFFYLNDEKMSTDQSYKHHFSIPIQIYIWQWNPSLFWIYRYRPSNSWICNGGLVSRKRVNITQN